MKIERLLSFFSVLMKPKIPPFLVTSCTNKVFIAISISMLPKTISIIAPIRIGIATVPKSELPI